jgi:leukotriene-A4 hydrolase
MRFFSSLPPRTGHADLTLEGTSSAAPVAVVVLDSKALTITAVTAVATGAALAFDHASVAEDDVFGRPLRITLAHPLAHGERAVIRIAYSTSPTASAVQWLPPAQTSGKVHPYVSAFGRSAERGVLSSHRGYWWVKVRLPW